MLLQRLREYAEERMHMPPPMYQEQPIRYLIALRPDGSFLGIRDTASKADKAQTRGIRRLAPHVKRASGIKSKLLADNAEYAFGLGGEGSKPERVAQQHEAFTALVEACLDKTEEPSVAAVAAFLNALNIEALGLPADFDPKATLTFEIEGEAELPIDLRSVQRFWAATVGPDEEAGSDQNGDLLPCIGCGELRPALERHPLKIKGVPGGQILKDLISANEGAFLSYGLKASQIAPTCQPCAEAYGNALNALLADRETSLWIGGAAYAFWTREPAVFSFARIVSEPENRQAEVKSLMQAHQTGKAHAVNVDANAFYAVGLGASGARLVVRDWIDVSVGEVERRLGRYFTLQEMVGWDGEPWAPLPMYRLTGATVRDPRKEEPAPIVAQALIRLALTGAPLPLDVLYLAVRRNRAAQAVNQERAMLIKMVLQSQAVEGEERTMAELEMANAQPAYLCGRLLAVLDRVQALAIGNPNASIIDKFYGSASSAPASVFGTLLHGAQNHLGKLQRDRPGAHRRLQEQIEEIAAPLAEFPKTLALEEQGLFALGFYHQRAADRRAAKDAAEARKSGTGAAEAE
jgi:CRISPR-associated protein Csd1